MILVVLIILPLLILSNLILIGICLWHKKISPISAILCIATPLVVLLIHSNIFPATKSNELFVPDYLDYYLVQTVVNACVFIALQLSLKYEKNPRKNYYRDEDKNDDKRKAEDDF
jgi:hypothetical protein